MFLLKQSVIQILPLQCSDKIKARESKAPSKQGAKGRFMGIVVAHHGLVHLETQIHLESLKQLRVNKLVVTRTLNIAKMYESGA